MKTHGLTLLACAAVLPCIHHQKHIRISQTHPNCHPWKLLALVGNACDLTVRLVVEAVALGSPLPHIIISSLNDCSNSIRVLCCSGSRSRSGSGCMWLGGAWVGGLGSSLAAVGAQQSLRLEGLPAQRRLETQPIRSEPPAESRYVCAWWGIRTYRQPRF